MKNYLKHPDDVVDYRVLWSQWLGLTDTITSSSFSITGIGLTQHSTTFDDTSTEIWIGGGGDNTTYTVWNTIETTEGRTATRGFTITVKTNLL